MSDQHELHLAYTAEVQKKNQELHEENKLLHEERANLMDGVAFMQELINEKDAEIAILRGILQEQSDHSSGAYDGPTLNG